MSIVTKHQCFFFAAALAALAGCSQTPNEAAPTQSQAAPSEGATHVVTKNSLNTAAVSDGHCSLDEINDIALSDASPTATVKAGQSLTGGGWAVTSALKAPAKLTLILRKMDSDEAYGINGETGVARPDVAKAMNSDAASTSGFNIAGLLGNTPAGQYKISLLTNISGKSELCDTKREVTIEN